MNRHRDIADRKTRCGDYLRQYFSMFPLFSPTLYVYIRRFGKRRSKTYLFSVRWKTDYNDGTRRYKTHHVQGFFRRLQIAKICYCLLLLGFRLITKEGEYVRRKGKKKGAKNIATD
jgi:hypothetical protein